MGDPAATAKDEGPGEERALVCVACAHPITHEGCRVEVGGSHRHTRLNPAGTLFHFGCFSRAEGCVVSGPPTLEHTWFPGHAWQYASCARCRAHVGWFFMGDRTFFGLILDRLAGE
ncbi:MAG: hypothetical protein HYZ28_13990 [Myxococcales bacterium]|nr:hypothetical protein [Myxococcales bacterium]